MCGGFCGTSPQSLACSASAQGLLEWGEPSLSRHLQKEWSQMYLQLAQLPQMAAEHLAMVLLQIALALMAQQMRPWGCLAALGLRDLERR